MKPSGSLSAPVPVRVNGTLFEDMDISAVERVGDGLYVAADEGRDLQHLQRDADGGYRLHGYYSLKHGGAIEKPSKGREYDLEDMAYDGSGYLYLVASHSAKRRLLDDSPEPSRKRCLKRLSRILPEKKRRLLLRLRLDERGYPKGRPETLSLWKSIKRIPLLKPFTALPSKENGIDIEGLAVAGDRLYVGFRGPVLRDNWVPVLVGPFDEFPKRSQLKLIRLDGLGIRSMVSLGGEGILILAGPVGDGPGGYHLYLWDGRDQLPARDGEGGRVRYLDRVPVSGDYKGEGMAVLSRRERELELLIAHDGGMNGDMSRFDLKL